VSRDTRQFAYTPGMETKPIHPGAYVRDEVLTPRRLSVMAAAKLLDVGRPALSAFLNGRASASLAMVKRLEVAFGLDAQRLLEMQAQFDAAQATETGAATTVRRYVVPLLQHKASEIEGWVSRSLNARARLAVLVRTLVNSTAVSLTKVDFPGNDDAERPGWDGWTECAAATPWIPAGKAGWEMGTNARPKEKADGDYEKSVKAHSQSEMAHTTFVFITPRHWAGKGEWVKQRQAEKKWKDVRAYDSSDLEQWVEQSVSAQAWLTTELGKPTEGVLSLDDAWTLWAGVTKPPLFPKLFQSVLPKAQAEFSAWLSKSPEKPFILASDSTEEALGLLSVLFAGPDETLAGARDRAIVFSQGGVFPRVAESLKDLVVVAAARDVEREVGPYVGKLHAVILQPRNAANSAARLTLEPLTGEAFRKAFEESSFNSDEVTRLARESGRSLTVVRRRLATVPAIKTPGWAHRVETCTQLAPLVLAGTWNSDNKADCAELVALAAESAYEEIEQCVSDATALDDPPFWMVSTFRGVTSKIDFLFAAPAAFTRPLLQRFLEVAKCVLSEDDPTLDLPEDQRWAASIHNKSRAFSSALRDSIAETLVLLAVHGNHLFKATTGLDCEAEVNSLVRVLLEPLTTRRLEANSRDLMAYAEASPEVFLSILGKDVKQEVPASFGLLRPADGMFGGCPRSELLWALEGLAWSKETLPRSALILAKLATVDIRDNWSNKPISSLASIFRPWMPQTAADHDERVNVLKLVIQKQPDVGWRLLMSLLPRGPQVGHYNHKPRWRNDGYGHGEPIPKQNPVMRFMVAVADIALDWPSGYDADKLCDLVEALPSLGTPYADKLWAHLKTWSASASDSDKAKVREKIRVSLLSRRAKIAGEKLPDWAARTRQANEAYESLVPNDVVSRHSWLFKDSWVQESADELTARESFETRERRIQELRAKALLEIYSAQGITGLHALARSGKAARVVGAISAAHALNPEQLQTLIESTMRTQPLEAPMRELVSGAVFATSEKVRSALLDALASSLDTELYCELLTLAPFNHETWARVDSLDEERRIQYWHDVHPWFADESEVQEAVERLALAGRPRAAFSVSQHHVDRLEPVTLYNLMSQIARSQEQEPGGHQLEQHWLVAAFEKLDAATELTVEQKAFLEFAYIDALWVMRGERDTHHVPNLEKYIEEHPEFYVQALVWAFKRRDGDVDPDELRPPPEAASNLALRAYKLLESITRLPAYAGSEDAAYSNLSVWIGHVRKSAEQLSRLEVADSCIGKMLAAEKPGADGVWPGELARRAIEEAESEEMAEGARVAAFNSRGVVWRGRGGDQEREVAAKYRSWAGSLRYTHPFVSTVLLQALADSYQRMANQEDDREVLRERVRT
jgi:addiction module HigA family antidote